MIMRRIAVVAALAVVAAACGGGDDAAPGDAPAQTTSAAGSTSDGTTAPTDGIEVVLSEFAFEPGSFEVAAGESVTFVVTNTGVVEHELRLSNTTRIEEHLEGGHADDDHDEAVGEESDADHDDEVDSDVDAEDVFLLLDPGETGELTFTAPDDRSLYTEVVCLVPGHYEAGMKAPLTISS